MSAVRYHLVWLATAVLTMLVIGLIYPNTPVPLLGAFGLPGAAAIGTFVENALFVRRLNRRSTFIERLKFSLWCGGLAFPVFFLTSFTLLALSTLLSSVPSTAQVPIHNFWVFLTFVPGIGHYSHYVSIPVVFILVLLLSTFWAYVSRAATSPNTSETVS